MKTEHINTTYEEGGADHHFDEDNYDMMLFRQDWNGAEKVYFNLKELDKIEDKIDAGEIEIHHNYSILYVKNPEILEEIQNRWDYCYITEI